MNERVTMSGRTAAGPTVGLGVFVLGLAAAFLAGALVVGMRSTQGPASVSAQTTVEEATSGLVAPVPPAVSAGTGAPGAEYRRIPDDGGGSGFATAVPRATSAVIRRPGDEYKRIPDDAGTP